jgi:nicotinamide mononucleotide transporter
LFKNLNVLHLLLKRQYNAQWYEFAGFVTSLVAVYLVAVEHILNWPVGLISVTIYGYAFFVGRLYADSSLQLFYFALGVQGWYFWTKGGKDKSELVISRIPTIWWLWISGFIVIGTAIYFPIIKHFNGAAPFADSLLTVGSIVAQLLINAKKLENWILWIVIDIAFIPLYISRQYYMTAYLYAFFLLLAVLGLYKWIKTYRGLTSTVTT